MSRGERSRNGHGIPHHSSGPAGHASSGSHSCCPAGDSLRGKISGTVTFRHVVGPVTVPGGPPCRATEIVVGIPFAEGSAEKVARREIIRRNDMPGAVSTVTVRASSPCKTKVRGVPHCKAPSFTLKVSHGTHSRYSASSAFTRGVTCGRSGAGVDGSSGPRIILAETSSGVARSPARAVAARAGS